MHDGAVSGTLLEVLTYQVVRQRMKGNWKHAPEQEMHADGKLCRTDCWEAAFLLK